MWVVKLGGSLCASPHLRAWLDVLATYGRGRGVVVPGGGPFADQVRRSQAHWGVGDATAHAMALLAMEQVGLLLAGLCEDLHPVRSMPELRNALNAGRVPVWLPSAMVLDRVDIPESWAVTSDSLALWLAGRLRASRLLLVKSTPLPESVREAEAAAQAGLVDQAFPAFMARIGRPVHWLTAGEYGRFRGWLDGDETSPVLVG